MSRRAPPPDTPPPGPAQDVLRIIDVAPRVLFLRIERTMQKRLSFLESLGVGDKIGRIIARAPNLLYTNVEELLEPRVQFLQYVLGLSREEVRCGSSALWCATD